MLKIRGTLWAPKKWRPKTLHFFWHIMQIIPGGISKIKAVATTTFVYKVFPPKTRRGYVIFNRLKTAIFRTNADQKSYSFSLIPGGKKTKKPAQKRWLRFENVLFRYDYIDVDELLAAREDYRKKMMANSVRRRNYLNRLSQSWKRSSSDVGGGSRSRSARSAPDSSNCTKEDTSEGTTSTKYLWVLEVQVR